MNLRQEILQNFSRHHQSYDQAAQVQRHAANLLQGLLPSDLPPGPILEIGCGTGLLTDHLIQAYPKRELHITDLSPTMVAHAQARFAGHNNLQFYPLNGEQLPPGQSYAAIVSSFTLQWFLDLPTAFANLIACLQPNGALVISAQGGQSYPQWRAACQALQQICTLNPLPQKEDLLQWCQGYPHQVQSHLLDVAYPNAESFFHQLKALGATTNLGQGHLRPSEMKALLAHLNQKGEVKMTAEILLLRLRKS